MSQNIFTIAGTIVFMRLNSSMFSMVMLFFYSFLLSCWALLVIFL